MGLRMTNSLINIFEQMGLKPKELLKSDPSIEFRPDSHRYYDLKNKHWVSHSISEVIAEGDDYFDKALRGDYGKKKQKEIQDSIRRGNIIHECVETLFKTGKAPSAGEYQPWLDSFLNYKNLETWECIASEIRLVDRRYSIAGSIDFILQSKEDGRIALCDLKTRSPSFSKNNHKIMKQLGGYLILLYQNYPSIKIDTCRAYWVTSEKTTTDTYQVLDCQQLFERARMLFRQKQPTF